MSNKKNIDRLFQERFKDFEAAPPMAAWDNIEKELDSKKPVAVIPLWVKWIGIAVGIALLATLGYTSYSSMSNNVDTHREIVVEENNQDFDKNTNSTTQENVLNEPLLNNQGNNNLTVDSNTTDNDTLDNNVLTSSTNDDSPDQIIIGDNGNKRITTNKSDTAKAINYKSSSIVNNTTQKSTTINDRYSDKDKKSTPYYSTTVNSNKGNNKQNNTNPVVKNTPQSGIALGQQSTKKDVFENETLNQNKKLLLPNQKRTDSINKLKTPLTENTDIAATETLQDSTLNKKSLEEVAAQQKEEEENIDALPFKKWNASSVLAPVFSSTLGGSSIDEQFVDNQKSTGLNLSYGVNVAYNISSRLSIRTGVHKVNVSYTTNDIIYGLQSSPGDIELLTEGSFDRKAVSNPGDILPDDLGSSFSQEFLFDNTFNGFQGEISQRLGYLEIPLEVRYKLLDSKSRFNVNVMGGMSALFLTDNSIAVTNTTSKLELGEDDNFNSFNQSANFGLGIDYFFTDQLGVTVEPIFKYQLNALRENIAGFKPFNIGIYSGITYNF